jgi:hypothetical protein
MINHIDVSTVLRRTVCDLYSNLVTRSTGAAVRTEIEQQLADINDRTLTVIDFSNVGLLDYSCADEIVAKLLLRYTDERDGGDHPVRREGYFLFRGIRESHADAIEAVLEKRGLALVAETDDGAPLLLGTVGEGERAAWQAVTRLGRAGPHDVAREVGLGVGDAEVVLGTLTRRRLVVRLGDAYSAVGGTP